jgi:hypothetical protein
MATNRFNPRNNVEALQQRQRDARIARGEEIRIEPMTFRTPEPARNTNPWGEWGTRMNDWLNVPLTVNTTRADTGRTFTTTVTGGTTGTTNRFTIGDFDRAARQVEEVRQVDRIREQLRMDLLGDRVTNADPFMRMDMDALRPRAEPIRPNFDWNAPIRPAAAVQPVDVRMGHAEADLTRRLDEEARYQARRNRSNDPASINFKIGEKSRKKAEATRQRYVTAMVLNLPYSGKLFNYHPQSDKRIGTWYVGLIPVAEISLDSYRVSRIMLPSVSSTATNEAVLNRTRFLWRQLGIKAVRHKDRTVVHTGIAGNVLKPGEEWMISSEYIQPFIAEAKRTAEQQEMFILEKSLGYKTKPVNWVNINDKTFDWGFYPSGPGGESFELNQPPALAEENS